MRSLRTILVVAVLCIAGCDRGENEVDSSASSSDSHKELIAKFQDGQKRFKELIATVRDEESFDMAKPKLDKIVSDWREVAESLGELEPPSQNHQAEYRALIAEGHRATEPTGEDMISLLTIESRESDILRWLEEFAKAGRAVGSEMARLYGPVDFSGPENEIPEPDMDSITIDGVPIEQALDKSD